MRTICHLLGGLLMIGTVSASEPWELAVCIEYLHSNQVVRTPEDFAFSWRSNTLELAEWRIPAPKPTMAQLEAVKAQAIQWKREKDLAEKSDINRFEEPLKISLKALLRLINLRLPAGQKITEDELRAAIKEEL